MKIELLINHCDMFMYGCYGPLLDMNNPVAMDFFIFALLHITSTMFITTDSRSGPQGAFHKILDPMGYSNLLDGVDNALNSRVGKTTLKQYIRSKRNKLATHGELAFTSQPKEVQNVTFSKRSIQQFKDAMNSLELAVSLLKQKLEQLINS